MRLREALQRPRTPHPVGPANNRQTLQFLPKLLYTTIEVKARALSESKAQLDVFRCPIKEAQGDMRFGSTLRKFIYPPWRDSYIDYDKLKRLLHEDSSDKGSPHGRDEEDSWTEEDEGAFVDELVNVQLEKVHAFQVETYQKLRDRTSACEARLDLVATRRKRSPVNQNDDKAEVEEKGESQGADEQTMSQEEMDKTLREVLAELDRITKETNELAKYSRINYTGFLKAAKKHDRLHGHLYRVRPLLQVRLAALPFNKEDYSPLLYRLSAMYSFIRQHLDGVEQRGLSFSETRETGGELFTSYKFWVHPENLLEVKTVILRRLPVLVYNPQPSKVVEVTRKDPTITSIYFDDKKFSLYTRKVSRESEASSLRLRWYGQLSQNPEIIFEKKTVSDGGATEEERFPIKEKYVQPFIKGEYKMEKSLQKIHGRVGEDSEQAEKFQRSVDDIQQFIRENELQSVLRANYTRTAFQIPGDDRIRISLDTDLAFIREDAIDTERPCRDPDDWHRRDIDDNDWEYPFTKARKGEINRFPFAVLDIRLKQSKKKQEWVSELMNSHLVKETPRFSKFVHGVAVLFEDYVNSFPFWLSEVEIDIRRDPQKAWEEEQEKKAKAADDEFAVGSFIRSKSSPAFKPAVVSPVGSPVTPSSVLTSKSPKITADMTRRASIAHAKVPEMGDIPEEADSDDDGPQGNRRPQLSTTGRLRSILPSFSTSKYARARREQNVNLPPGVKDPGNWIKDRGELKIEPKVWLANERTFIRWQHVSILLASLSLGLYNAAGEHNNIARALAVVYTIIAIFAGAWGWGIYTYRRHLIRQRSGKDFDNVVGPIVVCIGLIVALCLNFGFKYRAAKQQDSRPHLVGNTFDFRGGDL